MSPNFRTLSAVFLTAYLSVASSLAIQKDLSVQFHNSQASNIHTQLEAPPCDIDCTNDFAEVMSFVLEYYQRREEEEEAEAGGYSSLSLKPFEDNPFLPADMRLPERPAFIAELDETHALYFSFS